MNETTAPAPTIERTPAAAAPVARTSRGFGRRFRNPWRKPRFLAGITWLYLAWSILPVAIAVLFSFNSGRSRSTWQGFSLQWWTGDPFNSLWHDPVLHDALIQSFRLSIITMIVAVPLGTLFAIGLDRWRGRVAAGANFAMLLSFVLPEIIIGVALFLFFTNLLKHVVGLGTIPQILGLVTFQISYAVIIVRARLLSIGKGYEEAAMDLGASPTQAVRRVLMPLLYPAIFASFVLVFADSVDDFIIVRYLSGPASSEPLSVKIYAAARASPTPAVNAAATVLLGTTLFAALLGLLVYRIATRGQRGGDAAKEFVSLQV
ncbi:MAG TPA: ABC transporter permease [Actinomycetota bacterium]